jgi:hypothetical protein
MIITYGDLKTLFANKYEQTSAPATGAEIRNLFLNLAVQNILDRRRWRWALKNGTATTDGTSDIALASDFSQHGVKEGTFKIDDEEWKQINEGDDYSTSEKVFFISGNDADGYTATFPSAIPETGLAVTYRYYRGHTSYTSDSDVCVVPKGEAVADLAVGNYFASEGENEDALPFLEAAENGIEEMAKQEARGKARRKMKDSFGGRIYDIKNLYR